MAILNARKPDSLRPEPPSQITMAGEIVRKGIHLTSILIPILYYLFGKQTMLYLLIPAAGVALGIDLARFRAPGFDASFRKWFGAILRPHEKSSARPKMNGATYVLISAVLCVVVFPKAVAIMAFSVLIISDTAGALIGRPFGRHKFLQKSLEGSLAFLVTGIGVVAAWSVVFDATWQVVVVGSVAAAVAMVAEAMSYGINIDDNFTIPATFGTVMWGGLALIGGMEIRALLSVG